METVKETDAIIQCDKDDAKGALETYRKVVSSIWKSTEVLLGGR